MSSTAHPRTAGAHGETTVHIGHEQLIIHDRYEVASILNDILIGTWFLVGSFFFFSETLVYAGTWLFVLGSVEMLIRPVIRFARRVHLKRYHPHMSAAVDAGHDY